MSYITAERLISMENKQKYKRLIKEASNARTKDCLSYKKARQKLKHERRAEKNQTQLTPFDAEKFFQDKLDTILSDVKKDILELENAIYLSNRQSIRAIKRRIQKRANKDIQYCEALAKTAQEIQKITGTHEERVEIGASRVRSMLMNS